MNISKVGLDLIYDFEGKLKLLPDGRYKAYRCPAGVWTIYAGCTEGVHEGMIVTEEEGEVMFRRELAKFEQGVQRLVTCEMNQCQFDALVSLSFNIGLAGFKRSSVLRYFNAGNIDKAAKSFALWNKGGGQVLRGLVRRRAAEAALFLSDPGPHDEPNMPQAVEQTPPAPSRTTIGIGTGLGVASVTGTIATTKEGVSVAKEIREIAPAGNSFIWPAIIVASAIIGVVVVLKWRG